MERISHTGGTSIEWQTIGDHVHGYFTISFHEHMLGSVSSNFVDIVIIGERIELGLKIGKIARGSSTTCKTIGFNYGKKKEGEG